ncbi:hypothetical protein D8674_010810 [Pyrus ussuriensis x Pyrus communis]|uniref:Uncharacterized protein n=1 Tax=Pyrus ussuriensis x Pyrus communis TaxID=2448454 RepID=A0A5N5G2N4_9ROSA|nr:hypothetical protein D8674_010810 [Pyrus ussuriensis x Pyrus communis]
MVEVTSCCFCRLVVVFTILYILHQSSVAESSLVYDVRGFGAKPNGVTDSTQAFLNAWGSSAKDFEEEGVQNVLIKKAVLKGTTNGLRIKIQFLDAVMLNVKNPILIDQNYCPGKATSTALFR